MREILDGLVGRVVETFAPYTEADPMAIAAQFIVAFGNAVGRGPHFYVGETRHGMNEFLAVVGRSARARKGDSWGCASRPLVEACPRWSEQIVNGLSSGEGLISAITESPDGGLMVVESEFASVLKRSGREGNTLSNIMRDTWDGKRRLQTMTRGNPLSAEDFHVSLIAHCTPEDLQQYLSDVDVANGFGNRFIFLLVERRQLLANPGRADEAAVQALVAEVCQALEFARSVERIDRSAAAIAYWAEWYPYLTQDFPGLYGALVARSEAHVARLSALFALLSHSPVVEPCHIYQAARFWQYSESCIHSIFGDRVGNKLANKILQKTTVGQSMDLTHLGRLVGGGHVTSSELRGAVDLLGRLGWFKVVAQPTGGRPATIVTRIA